jgi:hypothetical protein
MQYDQQIIDEICERITLGASLTTLLQSSSKYPSYAVFAKWRRQYPHVEEQLRAARESRTEFLRDRFCQIIDDIDEDNVQSSRAKMDGLKYLMSVENRGQYGEKKTDVSITGPTQIIIATGIEREAKNVQIESASTAARGSGAIQSVSTDGRESTCEVLADPSTAEQSR